MRTFTVAELAKRIFRNGENLELVGDRIRNWVSYGLLEPLGEKNPGTGRSIAFPETALFEACLLLELLDCLGVQPAKARNYARPFRAVELTVDYDKSQKPYLVFSRGVEEGSIRTVAKDDLVDTLQSSTFVAHIVIDLSRLSERLEQPHPGSR
jgi:hypothetical protein